MQWWGKGLFGNVYFIEEYLIFKWCSPFLDLKTNQNDGFMIVFTNLLQPVFIAMSLILKSFTQKMISFVSNRSCLVCYGDGQVNCMFPDYYNIFANMLFKSQTEFYCSASRMSIGTILNVLILTNWVPEF